MANNYSLRVEVENLNLNDLNKLYALIHEWEESTTNLGKKTRVTVSYKDPIGGLHSEGLGWDPEGTSCGECSFITCEECGTYRRQIKEAKKGKEKTNGEAHQRGTDSKNL
jgi:hypothetical protein